MLNVSFCKLNPAYKDFSGAFNIHNQLLTFVNVSHSWSIWKSPRLRCVQFKQTDAPTAEEEQTDHLLNIYSGIHTVFKLISSFHFEIELTLWTWQTLFYRTALKTEAESTITSKRWVLFCFVFFSSSFFLHKHSDKWNRHTQHKAFSFLKTFSVVCD